MILLHKKPKEKLQHLLPVTTLHPEKFIEEADARQEQKDKKEKELDKIKKEAVKQAKQAKAKEKKEKKKPNPRRKAIPLHPRL